MGNASYHRFIYETLLRYPGVVTLHDVALAGFHVWYATQPGVAPDHLESELAYEKARQAQQEIGFEQAYAALDLSASPGQIEEDCLAAGVFLNRRVFECAERVILTHPWGRDYVASRHPDCLGQAHVIPLGTVVRHGASREQKQARAVFGIDPEAMVLGVFGTVASAKYCVETVEALAKILPQCPHALLMFVGRDLAGSDSAGAAARATELGIRQHVRFLGHQPAELFEQLILTADIGIALRRPPTRGEFSAGVLELLAAGVPTIVNDCATFSSLPEEIVYKVPTDGDLPEQLANAMIAMTSDPSRRQRQASAARLYICQHHAWPAIGRAYVKALGHAECLSTTPAENVAVA